MKINFQKLMRVLPSFITVSLIVVFCVSPAFAAGERVSVWDYAEVQVDGFSKKVTITFPDELCEISVIKNGSVVEQERGNMSEFDLTPYDFGDYSHVAFSPLGYYFAPYNDTVYDGFYLDLSPIPSGSILAFSVFVHIDGIDATKSYAYYCNYGYGAYDVQTGKITDKVIESVAVQQIDSATFSASYEVELNHGYSNFVPQITFGIVGLPTVTGRWLFNLDEFKIETTIDALKTLEENSEKTNELLEEIREQNNITLQNWQDFLDGKKEWQDIVDESSDQIHDSIGDMNDIGDALATVPKPEIDIDTLVPDELAGQEYLNYTEVLTRIWENPIISTTVYIMGLMLIVSYLLFGERG